MTLVAGISLGGWPAFVGDLLLSWRSPSEAILPTQPQPGVFPGAAGEYAHGLAQKLVIVRPYLLLAWAGALRSALLLIEALDTILPLTAEELRGREQIMLSLLDDSPGDIEFVVLYAKGTTIYPFCARTRGVEIEGQRLYILGSGGPEFFKYAQGNLNEIPKVDNRDGVMAQSVAPRFAATAMLFQWTMGYGLSGSFGGGFEVAHPTPQGFRKIDNLLVRGLTLGPNGEIGGVGPRFLQHYEGADLHLTSFAEDGTTFVVQSPLPSATRGAWKTEVIPEWTVDIIYDGAIQNFAIAVQRDPSGSASHSLFEFEDGVLVGWRMDQERVRAIIRGWRDARERGTAFVSRPL